MSGDDEGEPIAYLGGADSGAESDGYAGYGSPSRSPSPEVAARPAKKSRNAELEDDEELALRLLRGE